MNLLVVSHACATPVNQRLFGVVEEVTGWNITLVGPSTWKDDYGSVRCFKRWPSFSGRIRTFPVLLNGNVPLHMYRSTFRDLLRETKPDAIYMHHEPYGAATAQVYLANHLFHGCPIGFFTWQNIEKSYPPPFRAFEKRVFEVSDFACVGSESAEHVLRQKGYEGPCTLLPGSIDPEFHAPNPLQTELISELGISPHEVIVGFMGRVSAVKGLDTTLEALATLSSEPWRFVVVGDGDHTLYLRKHAQRLNISDRVEFVGYVPHTQAPRYLSFFDILLLPSETQPNWKEQFGRVIIEAMACGTAVIGSDSGEIPNVIRRTQGGLVFPEKDIPALAEQIQTLIQDPAYRNSLASQGRLSVLSDFTDKALAVRFAKAISDACNLTLHFPAGATV